jgi:hypothetical protein
MTNNDISNQQKYLTFFLGNVKILHFIIQKMCNEFNKLSKYSKQIRYGHDKINLKEKKW